MTTIEAPLEDLTTPIPPAKPVGAAASSPSDRGQATGETHAWCAAVTSSPDDQGTRETQGPRVVGGTSGDGQANRETQRPRVVPTSSDPTRVSAKPRDGASGPTPLQSADHESPETHDAGVGWLELRIWAEQFNDAQQARIAAANKAERGGVDPAIFAGYLELLEGVENQARLDMRRCYRRVVPDPIRTFQADTRGAGEHEVARLLGRLGHPVHAEPWHWEGTGAKRKLVAGEPFDRTVGQLWQYCGHGQPGRLTKGLSAEELARRGSPMLKAQVWRIASSLIKAGVRNIDADDTDGYDATGREALSAYGDLYLSLRGEDRCHTVECVRCGPSGKPAQPGSPWSAGHAHAHAVRLVGKAFLKDLWIVAGGGA